LQLKIKEIITYIDKLQFPDPHETEVSPIEGPRLNEDFFSIPLEQYLSGRNSRFDLYLKLNSNKFVKVLHQGDSFDINFLSGLDQRGVSVLYINRNKLSDYLKIQEKILLTIARDYEANLKLKSYIICGQGAQIFTSFQELRDSQCLNNIDLFIPAVQNLVEEFRMKFKNNFFEHLLNETSGYHHSVTSALLGIIFAKGQKILSQGPLRTIVIASMFHDISLENEIEAEKSIENEKFKQHPLESERLLSHHHFFDSAVLQAVKQHHMRIRGESFPSMAKNEVINQTSQIVGLADEISNSLVKVMGNFDIKKMQIFEAYLEEKVFPNFSRGLVDSTREIMFKKKKN